MLHIRLNILLAVFIALSGCSNGVSLTYRPSLLQFSTPEVSGKPLGGSASISIAIPPDEYEYATLTANNVLTTSVSYNIPTPEEGAHLWLGAFDNTDFYYGRIAGGTTTLGFKTQLIGSSRTQLESGVKLSVMLRGGKSSSSGSVDNNTASKTQSITTVSGSVNLGYRTNEHFLAYLNCFINDDNIAGDLAYKGNTVYSHNSSSQTYGILAGMQLTIFNSYFGIIEAGKAEVDWPVYGKKIENSVGASVGYAW